MENKWGRESPFLSPDIWSISRDLSAANGRRLPGTWNLETPCKVSRAHQELFLAAVLQLRVGGLLSVQG